MSALPARPFFASADGSIQIPFNPQLAKAVGGIVQSILLRQLGYWIKNDAIDFYDPHIIYNDGLWYIRLTSAQIEQRLSGCVSDRSIRRYLEELADKQLLILTTEFNDSPLDKRYWIALIPETVQRLPGVEYINPVSSIGQNDQSSGQNDQPDASSSNGSIKPEMQTSPIGQNVQSLYIYKDIEEGKPKKEGEKDSAASAAPSELQSSISEAIDFMAVKDAIAAACQLDPVLRDGMLGKYAKHIITAGYGPQSILDAVEYWYQQDWRGKKGDVPRIDELIDTLPRSRAWKADLANDYESVSSSAELKEHYQQQREHSQLAYCDRCNRNLMIHDGNVRRCRCGHEVPLTERQRELIEKFEVQA